MKPCPSDIVPPPIRCQVEWSTHRVLTGFLLVQHLSERLQDLDAQLFLLVHKLLGVFDQPGRETTSAPSLTMESSWCTQWWHTSQNKTAFYWSAQVKSPFLVSREVRQLQQSNSTPGGLIMYRTVFKICLSLFSSHIKNYLLLSNIYFVPLFTFSSFPNVPDLHNKYNSGNNRFFTLPKSHYFIFLLIFNIH